MRDFGLLGGLGRGLLWSPEEPLEVAEQFDDWPEKGERRRHWATLAEARRLLSEPGLVALAEKIAASARG